MTVAAARWFEFVFLVLINDFHGPEAATGQEERKGDEKAGTEWCAGKRAAARMAAQGLEPAPAPRGKRLADAEFAHLGVEGVAADPQGPGRMTDIAPVV